MGGDSRYDFPLCSIYNQNAHYGDRIRTAYCISHRVDMQRPKNPSLLMQVPPQPTKSQKIGTINRKGALSEVRNLFVPIAVVNPPILYNPVESTKTPLHVLKRRVAIMAIRSKYNLGAGTTHLRTHSQ